MRAPSPVLLCLVVLTVAAAACTASRPAPRSVSTGAPSSLPVRASTSAVVPAPAPAATHARSTAAAPSRSAAARLPLGFATGDATRVITVVASSASDTSAVLQAWQKSGLSWNRFGPAVTAQIGSDGMSSHASESKSATPIGSFTLTQAFGHDPNPGTSLPYRPTTPADWWISEPGPLYNTLQHCASRCPFTQGIPNEHLYETMPYYTYAVVIDYNRSPVVQGAGSAFFLHVTVGQPTQGCVALPESNLVALMRWLTPDAHPRILIGVAG